MTHFIQFFAFFVSYGIISADILLDHVCEERSVCAIEYDIPGVDSFEMENKYITRLQMVRFPDSILDISNVPKLDSVYIEHQSSLPSSLCDVLRGGVYTCVKIYVDALKPVSCCKLSVLNGRSAL